MSDRESSTKHEGMETEQDTAAGVVATTHELVASTSGAVHQAASTIIDTTATSVLTSTVSEKVDQVSDQAASTIEQFADTIAGTIYRSNMSEGTRQVTATTVDVLDRTARYLRDADVSVVVNDVRHVVQRHPLRALVLGLGLGYLARSVLFPTARGHEHTSAQPQRDSATPVMPISEDVSGYAGAGYDVSTDIGYGAYDAAIVGSLTEMDTLERILADNEAEGEDNVTHTADSSDVGSLGVRHDGDLTDVDPLAIGLDDTSSSLGEVVTELMDDSPTEGVQERTPNTADTVDTGTRSDDNASRSGSVQS